MIGGGCFGLVLWKRQQSNERSNCKFVMNSRRTKRGQEQNSTSTTDERGQEKAVNEKQSEPGLRTDQLYVLGLLILPSKTSYVMEVKRNQKQICP